MALKIKKIIFTTDLSPQSRKAFDYAVSLAVRYGATITILHVIEELPQYPSEYLKGFLGAEKWKELQESHEQEARQILIGKKKEGAMIREALSEFCQDAQKNHGEHGDTVDEIVVSMGKVVDEILTESKTRNCDLIVMGYYVRGKLEEAVVGSTPRRLMRRSKIPIMLVPLPDRAA